MERSKVVYLLRKHIGGELTTDEKNELISWADSHPANRALLHKAADTTWLTNTLRDYDHVLPAEEEAVAQALARHIMRQDTAQRRPSRKISRRLSTAATWWMCAAAMILAVTCAWLLLNSRHAAEGQRNVASDIAPGGNKAVLTLPNGRTIDLSEAQSGIEVGDQITYYDGTAIHIPGYDGKQILTSPDHMGARMGTSPLLKLSTPRGGIYELVLSDGSQVWLNSASTITYPVQFTDSLRIVELSGEGYFAVTKDAKRPFRVITKGQAVQVLGTEFNITAYDDEEVTKTTLVSGAVKVAAPMTKPVFLKQPGEQAVINGQIRKQTASVDDEIAWRHGKFSFNNKTFEQVMQDLSRWYDLEIVYERNVPDAELMGDAFRNQNLGLVLRVLDVAEIDYHLDVRQRQLTIK
ncbi:FecR domain-containing protein [Parapedobacter deserti]|uniref:FecR domain-containing protein n=1 Tax=Parapedobacter deserti TaxID=1912957 RepID=A0ABV7JNV7_9SPHI